jgi:NADH-quinone oxidoreductase subunit M
MILASLILIPVLGAALCWWSERIHPDAPRWVALAALGAELFVAIAAAAQGSGGPFLAETRWPWIPELGITFRLGLDGISFPLLLLTIGLGILAVAVSWREITFRVGAFHLSLLLTVAGVAGVFLALDLFAFFFFWELMLVPMYFIIAAWGHERRVYAAIKFFIFTQGSGLLMLVAILALVLAHYGETGTLTFDYFDLLGTPLDPAVAFWIMLGFFIAFAVKLPAFLFHTWLPDAHTQAPTAGSVLLAGVLLKTGAYGLIRFAVPLFPDAAMRFAPVAMLLAVIGIIYGAVLAFAQYDMKRLVAYSSVSHMGFVLLGIFAWNALSLQGALVEMIAHGISTGALFILVGLVQERLHTRDMRALGGLATTFPRLAAMAMLFAVATLGLPGLGNFVGEVLVLAGSFRVSPTLTAVAAVGLVAAVLYALSLLQYAFQGRPQTLVRALDLNGREMGIAGALAVAILWLGFWPQPLLDLTSGGIANLQPRQLGRLDPPP